MCQKIKINNEELCVGDEFLSHKTNCVWIVVSIGDKLNPHMIYLMEKCTNRKLEILLEVGLAIFKKGKLRRIGE